jgi:hypothetical protein
LHGQDTVRLPRGGHYGTALLPMAQGVRRTEAGVGQATRAAGKGERQAQSIGGGGSLEKQILKDGAEEMFDVPRGAGARWNARAPAIG